MKLSRAVWLGILLAGCTGPPDTLFVQRHDTGIEFTNALRYADAFNVYRYRNFYNGGGVALGDVNGDGLLDVFLTANQGANRLYLNQGDWTFEDVTERAGVGGQRAWSTGASMADVNGDGWLDIYVCNSGIESGDDQRNELYLNRGDGTFEEAASRLGIDDPGLSIHGSFFDYDRDGDLDLYLVNNSFKSILDFDLTVNERHLRHERGGDRLFANEEGTFVDVTEVAGLYSSEIGFGLGVSVGDLNGDGWADLYVSNDFFERDYLYLNNQDGTFTESLERSIKSVSAAAMGADMADLTGNGYADIFVTDMLPSDEVRLKTVTAFDDWPRYQNYVRDDYYHQFTRNTLHLNLGPAPRSDAHFAEIGRFAHVEASDWSWGAMIADFDHDGRRDIFVANGVYQDLTDADYLVEIRDEETMASLIDSASVDWATLIDMIPSNPVPNHMFAGGDALGFTDVTTEWGLDQPSFSNGSAYGDLDGDGDLDLVINNLHQPVGIYENRATEMHSNRAWLQLTLAGLAPNTFGVGARIRAWHGGHSWYAEQQPVRGYQSSVDPLLHLGLGSGMSFLDSLHVKWPSGSTSRLYAVATQQHIEVSEPGASPSTPAYAANTPSPWLQPVSPASLGLDWKHVENAYSDFDQQPLLFHMRSTEGPALCTGDPNGDGLQDLYLGGAKDQPGTLWLQDGSGGFMHSPQPALEEDRVAEDTDCVWFDSDGDGDDDLLVASGGSELPSSSTALIDRQYENENGTLTRRTDFFVPFEQGFEPTSVVTAADVDQDGDQDLFLGTRLMPFAYGLPVRSRLLLNGGHGAFSDATDRHAAALGVLGMITDAAWGDVDADGDLDLVVVGEWKAPTVLLNEGGTLTQWATGMESSLGWWQSVHLDDLDGDGDLDILAGNHGLNSRFRASPEAPITLWAGDFDRNGRADQIFAMTKDGLQYPMALRHDLVEQLPFLVRPYPTYESFAGATVQQIFEPEQLASAVRLQATEMRSMAFFNGGQGSFEPVPLPMEAQLSPLYAGLSVDVSGDGSKEILLGGNLYEAKPEVGRYDASYGSVLGADLAPVPWQQSGFWVDGAVRGMVHVSLPDQDVIVVAMNNDSLRVFVHGR